MTVTDLAVFSRPDHASPFRLVELAPDIALQTVLASSSTHFET